MLLRVPPHPACLARACVANKGLRRVITKPGFFRSFQEHHHNAPPLLGFFHDDIGLPSNFIPVGDKPDRVSAVAFDPKDLGWRVLDSRHGRVLLRSPDRLRFLVWEPMAGRRQYIDAPSPQHGEHYKFTNAALVCTVAMQENHISCHDCPLSVLFVVTPSQEGTTVVYLYSTEEGSWNEVASGDFSPLMVTERPVVLLRNVLYWTMAKVTGFPEAILGFELGAQNKLYVIEQPLYTFDADHEHVQVMEAEGGMVGLVVACGLGLQLWVLHEDNDKKGRERWAMDREIYLDEKLAPLPNPVFYDYYQIWILGVDGNVVFLRTETAIFEVDLQTEEAKRLCDGHEIAALYPYRSFYRRGSTIIYLT
ncbi:hypothetical protein HU200_002391 [Digitaria exilis]|uniref:F-box protein AT5G49610-like beta-propeller domain-containing protein n=1 Tax=Digitaria exilis TaxID=1010633 RepID=A0A835KWT1_9POAL|nr:hypothetical protein HU200_002391 [Digitaria exilis]